MNQSIKFQQVVAEDQAQEVTFALPAGAIAVLITSRQVESDQLVRLLLGFSRPQEGEVAVLGEEVGSLSEKALLSLRRRVAVVFPNGGLVSNLKVWENLVLPLEYHSACTQPEIRERGEAALRRVGYLGKLMELPGHLSLYESRQVGLARAMLGEPSLMVFNAMLDGLRDSEKSVLTAAALEFHRENNERTSLFITSNPESVKDIPFDSRIFLKGSASHAE
jgi:phospholipid/cholesterol/gamma-HCH transport system ATP-binding protein